VPAAQCQQALQNGREIVKALPGNAVLLGEMGIGNTSAASLLLARLVGLDIAQCTGAGTGLDAAAVQRKTTVLREVLARHAQATEPLAALAAFGGLEIATMVGALMQAAHRAGGRLHCQRQRPGGACLAAAGAAALHLRAPFG
jgi:nicotinate-nucleotide--dimethylbenzimidazole phosphoribosyltransferase